MIIELGMPSVDTEASRLVVYAIHAELSRPLAPGDKFLDLRMFVNGAGGHDCPAIAHFRLVVREKGWLRELSVAVGDEPRIGAVLGTMSTDLEESLLVKPARKARFMIAAIPPPSLW